MVAPMGSTRTWSAGATRAIAAACAVAAVTAAAGCGDESADTAAPKGDLPLKSYVTQADSICAAGRINALRTLAPLQVRLTRDRKMSDDDAMKLNAAGAKAVRPIFRKIAALGRPSTKAAEASTYLKTNRDTLAALDDAVEAYERGDRAATAKALQRNRAGAADIIRAAKALGLRICGTEFRDPSPKAKR